MNTKKRILITGGRAPAALDLVRKFRDAGHDAFVADSFKYHMSRASKAVTKSFILPSPRNHTAEFIEKLNKIIIEEEITHLIPTCEEIYHIAKFRSLLSPSCHVFVDSLEKLNILHNKWLFNRLLDEGNDANFYAPRSWLIHSTTELEKYLTHASYDKLVLKAVYSRFASQVYFLINGDGLPDRLKINSANPWVLQEYIEGKHYCTFSVAQNGKLTAHTTYPVTFRTGNGASIYFEHTDNEKIFEGVRNLVQKMHFSGQIAFDLIESSDGKVFAIECNPRATSGIHLYTKKEKLEEAYLDEDCELRIPHNETRRLLSFPMWTYGLAAVKSKQQFMEWFKKALTTKDVIFRWNDPLPALYQYVEYFSFWIQSIKNKSSLLATTTSDIEWNGE